MLAVLVSLVALAAPSLAAELRVVVPSGTLVSGAGLTHFRDPSPTDDAGLLFRATTEVITLPDDAGGARSILASGTLTPDLADETINSFLDVQSTPDGFVAVLADLNGTTADRGIFVLDSGRLSTIVGRRVDAGDALSGPDINIAGDLTFAADAGVFRRLRATGLTSLVVPTGSEGIPRRPRIDQVGALVWLAGGGLFHWSDATGTRVVAHTGAPGPPGSGMITDLRRAAVHSTGGVAFIAGTSSVDGVFLWDATREETRLLAKVGDVTEGGDIIRIRPRVEFRSDGTVVFSAQVRQGRARRVRWVVVSGDTLTVSGGAGIASGGAAIERRESWYRRERGRVTTVARVGDVVPGIGPVEDLGRAAGSGASAVVAVTVAGRSMIVKAAGSGLEKIVADGDSIPKVGVVTLRDVEDASGFDAERGTLAFASAGAVVVLREGRGARVVPRPGDEGTFFPGAVLVRGGRVFVVGGFDAGRSGIFVVRHDRLRALVLVTDPAPVTPPVPFGSFGAVALGVRNIAFEADAGADVPRLFRWTKGRVALLRTDTGDPGAPLPVDALASGGGGAIFATQEAIYRSLPGGAAPIVSNAEVTSLGTLGIGVDEAPSIALVNGAVVFPAQLAGGPVRAALLARDLPAH